MTEYPKSLVLIAQRNALDAQIAAARQKEVREAVATIRQIMADLNLSHDDVFPAETKRGSGRGTSVRVPYARRPEMPSS